MWLFSSSAAKLLLNAAVFARKILLAVIGFVNDSNARIKTEDFSALDDFVEKIKRIEISGYTSTGPERFHVASNLTATFDLFEARDDRCSLAVLHSSSAM